MWKALTQRYPLVIERLSTPARMARREAHDVSAAGAAQPAGSPREEEVPLRRSRTGRPPRGAGSASDRGGSRKKPRLLLDAVAEACKALTLSSRKAPAQGGKAGDD